ncbi:MAG: L,D-transpeptidase [Kouleothrix sp.]|nr:L,D-transpeptidase [Kouleothrix sp.]
MTARLFRAWLALLVVLAGLSGIATARADGGALYFPATGHHLTDDQGFLSFWRTHQGERLLGFPIAEAASADGLTVQYFERGRLERPDDSGADQIRTGRVGAEYAEALWKRFAPAPPHKPAAAEQVFDATGHTLREPFLGFWRAAGGLEFFGPPISEAIWEMTAQGRQQVQYFERARLERDPQLAGTPDEVRVGELGRALALLRGVDVAPVDSWGAESYGPSAPAAPDVAALGAAPRLVVQPTSPPPAQPAAQPRAQPAAPAPQPQPAESSGGAKLIVVNLSDQWLYAYEGKQQVFDAPVSTGRDGMETPTGTYSVYAKLKVQTMDGVTDGKRWVVPNVPNVMYINGGVALHGTYWHNRFGTGARLSHGCVNLPLDAAAWLYRWSPMGTTVKVTY